MSFFQERLTFNTRGKGTYDISRDVQNVLAKSELKNGIASIFCQHTSCSLVLMENGDPASRADLEAYMERLVPENEPYFQHTLEGPDDMPSHIRMALTRSGEAIPFTDGKLQLGTWQSLYLWEHRAIPHTRFVLVTLLGE